MTQCYHPNQHVGLRDIIKLTNRSRSTILRMIDAGEFPKPKKIGGKNTWLFKTVEDWNLEQFNG